MSPDDAPSSLQPLLDRLKAGDPAAVNDIITHCQERLRLLTRQMLRKFPGVRRWEETSDVFHDVVATLAVALREIPMDTPADFLRLAACHIRRRLIDLSRKCRPELLPGPDSDESGPAAPEPSAGTDDPYNLAAWGEFHSKIDELPDEDQVLFDLIYYQGLTQPEAAVVLGVPLRTLKRRWQRARENLGRLLGGELPF
jgi:RNA polymerase sigma-70 factor (ECF subfamily)